MEYIEAVLEKLKDTNMEFEDESDVAGFLGVHIARDTAHGKITLTQSGLCERIVKALKIGHLPKTDTPAAYGALPKDIDGDPIHGEYNYKSIIGMLQYSQGHCRPDITFAVSQCARFVHSPRRSHEIALERIGQYLKGTMDKVLILICLLIRWISIASSTLILQDFGHTKIVWIQVALKAELDMSSASPDALLYGKANCKLRSPRLPWKASMSP